MLDGRVATSLKLMGGARVESFHQQIDVSSPFAQPGATPTEGSDRTNVDVLPAAAVILAPRDDMNVADIVINVQTGTGNRIEAWDANGTPVPNVGRVRRLIVVGRLTMGR